MGASISYKLKNSLQGALAGGGDPATSPLYVFGPFLSLIVGAGVANITFGASIWLAVFTVVTVSAMYRYVMKWVTDGSGGSGLSEEEFGSWAVKVNAAITVIEYTLTFLVSIAALVTFVADRFPILNSHIGFFHLRTFVAIFLSLVVAVTVNRGPKVSSQFFGPATALILAFLWLMIFSVIWQRGLHLPNFDIQALNSSHIHITLGGFSRILALMTGIEIFANLVASYEGTASQRSNRAFGSMLIVMASTVATMLVVGPAIFELSDPTDITKSVFTQTMDGLLPSWLSYMGTLIGVAVLLSAAAASAQGIQNLALGLRARHYIPAQWGKRNKFDVPSTPVWGQIAIIVVAFLLFGTHEETYLALYAAGVFILLSMTGWSACKRFSRLFSAQKNTENILGILVTLFSAVCASFATLIIFEERFTEGAWSYLVMVPALYMVFNFYRKRLGSPPESIDIRLSTALSASPLDLRESSNKVNYKIERILVPLNGKLSSEVAFYAALKTASKFGAAISPIYIRNGSPHSSEIGNYIHSLQEDWAGESSNIVPIIKDGDKNNELISLCVNGNFDLICISTSSLSSAEKLVRDPLVFQIVYATTPPLLLLRPSDTVKSRSTAFKNILVPLDGSLVAEQVLPYVTAWANQYGSKITLLIVPEEQGNPQIQKKLIAYLTAIKKNLVENGINTTVIVDGSGPARTILHYVDTEPFDLVAMVSHGRGGLERQSFVRLGSVTETVMLESDVPLLFISARPS